MAPPLATMDNGMDLLRTCSQTGVTAVVTYSRFPCPPVALPLSKQKGPFIILASAFEDESYLWRPEA